MTPATWSMVQLFMDRAMRTLSLPGYRGYGVVGGRFYLNLSLAMSLSGAVGISEKRFRALTTQTSSASSPPGSRSRRCR
jgi:pyruvate,water dikinase